MTKAIKLLTALPHHQRERLMTLAREVYFPEDTRIFESGGHADRFWVVRSGAVSLDQRLNEVQRITVAGLGAGDLLGWSWLFPRTSGTSGRWRSPRSGPTSSTRRPC